MYHICLNTHFSTYPGVCKSVDQIESEDKGVKIQRQAVGGLKLIMMCVLQRMIQICIELYQKMHH